MEIPDKFRGAFQSLLDQMEQETGNLYQLKIDQFDYLRTYSEPEYTIGDFTTRPFQIEIYDMKPEYKALEGLYNTRNDVINKIQELRCNDLFEEIKDWTDNRGYVYKIGKCKNCHSYNEDFLNRSPNTISSNCCQNNACPNRWFNSKWNDVKISTNDTTIYTCDGGTLSICHMKGHYRFIR
jgi:hypothetical protein